MPSKQPVGLPLVAPDVYLIMRFWGVLRLFFLTAVFCPAAMTGQSSSGPGYQVDFPSLTSASVNITLPAAPTQLYMATGATGRQDGFASYVRDLSAKCGGRSLALARTGATWKVVSSETGPCTVHYRVDLSFVTGKWEVGNEQAGFSDSKGTFVVSKALFLESDARGRRSITFTVPHGWSLITPWPSSTDHEFNFERDGALADLIAFGQLSSGATSSGAFRVTLVSFGELAGQQQEIFAAVQKIAAFYNQMFPGTAPSSYLIALIPGEEADGEAYDHGFASTVQTPLKTNERIVWADVIANEMFHYWNGHQLSAANSDGDLDGLAKDSPNISRASRSFKPAKSRRPTSCKSSPSTWDSTSTS